MNKIQDEFTHLENKYSKQYIKQLRYKRDNKCVLCGKDRHPLSIRFCEYHVMAARKRQRKLYCHKVCKLGMTRGYDFNGITGLPLKKSALIT